MRCAVHIAPSRPGNLIVKALAGNEYFQQLTKDYHEKLAVGVRYCCSLRQMSLGYLANLLPSGHVVL